MRDILSQGCLVASKCESGVLSDIAFSFYSLLTSGKTVLDCCRIFLDNKMLTVSDFFFFEKAFRGQSVICIFFSVIAAFIF